MANKDNECYQLSIEDMYTESISKNGNTLDELFSLQKDIQENVYGYDFEILREQPITNMKDFFMWNTHAQADEAHEAMDALGGIHDGIGSAIWKPWKKGHNPNMSFNDLSDRDKIELKMELIDELHFLFNKMHAVGMTSSELYNFYFSKNKENRDRQLRGY
jgi:hypothetical protein